MKKKAKIKVEKKYRMKNCINATGTCGLPEWCAGRLCVIDHLSVAHWPRVRFLRWPKDSAPNWYVKAEYLTPV